jgi:alpha/beta superfamily hydrolase
MRSIVTSALFEALPGRGYAALRFNFRGVEGSSGSWGEGLAEPLDVVGALDTLVSDVGPHVPVAVVGWSFGADMTFSVADPRIAAWEGIAAPLRFGTAYAVADDPRPKHLVLAAHDEFREPDSVIAEVAAWTNTTHEVITGASHFFVGRTDRVVDATDRFVSSIASS